MKGMTTQELELSKGKRPRGHGRFLGGDVPMYRIGPPGMPAAQRNTCGTLGWNTPIALM